MQINMTLSSIAGLFGTMTILAMIPSPSVFAVVARSIASGFTHGLITVIGIVVGDFVFIILAICGLSAIAETMDSLLILIKYLGAAYLIWLGIELWKSKSKTVEVEAIRESSWLSNFLTGLFITLGDQKAILFYLGFFPAFLELSSVSIVDTSIVLVIATIAVGGVKLGYAYLADKARSLFQSSKAKRGMNITAGIVMISTGIFLVAKT
ncbi:MAG: LysE family translocator [Xenococcaceae cyanobacterium MO_234.B1]|nr:LysE family translocator [Xenococcaceae cyanobacterium MO_234.B1]